MIEPKIIEAWQRLLIPTVMAYPMAEAMHVIANAYVQAEAGRRMASWKLKRGTSGKDSCDFWTLTDWEKTVRAELEKP